MKISKKTIYIILIATIAILTYSWITNDGYLKAEITDLEKERDCIQKEYDLLQLKSDSLSTKIIKEEQTAQNLLRLIYKLKSKADEVPNIVSDYDEQQLDSVLSNYRHPKRN